MVYKIVVIDDKMIKFFQRRNYFIRNYYKSVVLLAKSMEDVNEIDSIISRHKFDFDIFSDLDQIVPKRMTYEFLLNGFCVQDSNMKRFKDLLNGFISRFKSKILNKAFEIIDFQIVGENNMVFSINVRLSSYENIDISKQYFDYYFYSYINSMLKNYNIKKKKKNVISKK